MRFPAHRVLPGRRSLCVVASATLSAAALSGLVAPSATAQTALALAADTTVSASADPASFQHGGGATTLTVTGLPSDATGAVTFTDDGKGITLCTTTAEAGGCSPDSLLPVGSYSVSVSYAGDNNYNPSANADVTSFAVTTNYFQPYASTTPVTSTYGDTITFTETQDVPADATGELQFYAYYRDGNFTLASSFCVADVQARSCTMNNVPAGSYSDVRVSYSGDANYGFYAWFGDNFTVLKADTAVAVNDKVGYPTQATTVAPQELPGAAGGTVTFTDVDSGTQLCQSAPSGSCDIPTLPLGTYAVSADYSGDGNFNPSTITFTLNVVKTPVTMTLSIPDASVSYGTPVSLGVDGLASAASGLVDFVDSDGTTLCSMDAADGHCVTSSTLAPGTYQVTATYSGDADYATATATGSFIVAKSTVAITATVDDGSVNYGTAASLRVDGLPSGASGLVTFVDSHGTTLCSMDAADGSGPCLTSSTLAGGSYQVTATYSGDANYESATADTSFTVNQAPAITSADHATLPAGAVGTFTVTTNPGWPSTTSLSSTGMLPVGVSFTDNGDGTGTLTGTAPLSAIGTYPLTLSASNGGGDHTDQAFALTISRAARITLPALRPASDGPLHGVPAVTAPGTVLHVSGSGYAAGAPVTIGMYSTPTVLATVAATDTGTFAATIRVPNNLGRHVFIAAGLSSINTIRYLESSTLVVAGPLTPTAPTSSTGAAGVALANTGPDSNIPTSISWGIVLLLAGLVLVVAARRTRTFR
jgi:hypothetical protein